ncbi:MAG: hypothetical protein II274_04000, partial [Alistipes sp.]|nr:hypothetical protein [Alistipes sp.]
MKRISLLSIMLLLTLSACVAQNQSVTLQQDSIPAATIVPALQPAAGVRDTINENITIESRMTRTERRAKRAEDYAFKIDSLIATRAFAFYPTLMQAVPGGEIRQVYANYFYAYISPVDLEVHLPTEYGMAQQMSMINFDTEHIGNYTAVKYLTQWSISFLAKDDGVEYSFSLDISTITGRSVLNVESPKGT